MPPHDPDFEVKRKGLLARAPGERIQTDSGLRIGDVVQVAVELTDKVTKAPFWWKTFRVVMRIDPRRPNANPSPFLSVLTLKMHPDLDRDLREIDMRKDVVTYLREDAWPQGVAAMHMKLVAQGVIKLGD